ncbi:TPA: phosphoadenosine phosphosulfate reductase family protein [Pseudomonas aeruginosa]
MTFQSRFITTTPDIDRLLAANAAVAVGVSGGQDSQACQLAVHEHLNAIGHTGARIAVHAHLGRTEWTQSLRKCQEMAEFLGWELLVVSGGSGDMMDRWLTRWENNLSRYKDLKCVQLILPWSTASLRFCTSEKKVQPISRALKRRFPNQPVINVTGVRREESANRAKQPVSKSDSKIVTRGMEGATWNAIIDMKRSEVIPFIESYGLARHEAYTVFGMTRVSCTFCVLSSAGDLMSSTQCEENHAIYREMVGLEVTSTFSFQSGKWLGDVRPDLLSEEMRHGLEDAKRKANLRQIAEARIPKHLRYVKSWPVAVPTLTEAELLSDVRCTVADTLGLDINYRDPQSIVVRYEELMAMAEQKGRPSTSEFKELPSSLLIPVQQLDPMRHAWPF